MNAVDVIRTKRDGGRLSPEQIAWFVQGCADGSVADEQAAALLMAIVWRGMDAGELSAWTAAMLASGRRLDPSGVGRPTVDKHSTGGVGDKISLPLAPLVAACGAAVPMLSGRGLGHTGGTLDKLEAVPGLRVDLDADEMLRIVREVGCAICAAGDDLVPADRKLYALRDVTGTVESIPLIASSIMSKKLAEGSSSLVLDVKVGSGAFLPDLGDARRLAETMVGIGQAEGVPTVALLTDMDVPLGRAAGNALEVAESLEVLGGGGPPDVVELTVALAREMLSLAGIEADPAAVLASGGAMAVWRAMVRAQGGDPDAPLPVAPYREVVVAPRTGHVTRIDARAVGVAAWRLGAGRARQGEPVSASAGVVRCVGIGDHVEAGEPVLELHLEDCERLPDALEALRGAVTVGAEPPPPRRLVIERIAS